MATKEQFDAVWTNCTWLEMAPRTCLVDYSGLRVRKSTLVTLMGQSSHRPIILIIAAFVLLSVLLVPIPSSLSSMLMEEDPPGYSAMEPGTNTIVDSLNYHNNPREFLDLQQDGISAKGSEGPNSSERVARLALIMVGILLVAAMLWGTEALPIGGTVTLVAVLMLAFGVLPPDEIAKAFLNDSVFFILGLLAVAVGVSKTGLDKRIGLLLLSHIRSPWSFAIVFLPVISISSAFLSAHALVALLIPVIMGVYKASCMSNGVDKDRALAIFLFLGVSFAANIGGPGSPAAGARNAIMVGFFADSGFPISFFEWMKYGMPLVPLWALTVGSYMYLRCKPHFLVKTVNPSAVLTREVTKLPRFGGNEAVMTVILVSLVFGWITLQGSLGMGGVTLTAVFAMFLFKVVTWDDIQSGVAFDVVGLYAAASAIAVGLSLTGGGLWLANQTVAILPSFMNEGTGLIMGVTVMTGTLTNFMSDGVTVGVLGPLVLPMAEMGDVSVWKIGLAVSFASSLANVLVVGTPNNAIVFAMSKDPDTGKKLLSVFDFVKYGLPLTLLLLVVMWGWALLGYWTILAWP